MFILYIRNIWLVCCIGMAHDFSFIYLHVSLLFPPQTEQCCSSLESRLQGVGEVQSHVRDVFSRLADLDDELDNLSPVGRDSDSLASQADAVRGFLSRLNTLRTELEGHGGECTTMLRREGSSPDLLALRRETEALSRQTGKLAERGHKRLALIEAAEERVKEFYGRLADLQGLLGRAEEVLNTQAVVGTEVEVIKQQLLEFKVGKDLANCVFLCVLYHHLQYEITFCANHCLLTVFSVPQAVLEFQSWRAQPSYLNMSSCGTDDYILFFDI